MSSALQNPKYMLWLTKNVDKWNRCLTFVFDNEDKLNKFVDKQKYKDFMVFVQETESHIEGWRYNDAKMKLLRCSDEEELSGRKLVVAEREATIAFAYYEPVWWKLVSFPIRISNSIQDFDEEGK